MTSNIKIRAATSLDREFIFSLSANLANVADLSWHSREAVQTMQDGYIADMFASMFDGSTTPKTFLIAEQTDEFNEVHTAQPLGYIHVCERKDDISSEKCATVTLLAVSEIAQGKGIGKLLLQAAEYWAQLQGYRLLHLEVFANNSKAQVFYKNLGFNPEMMTMIKKF